MKPRYRAWDKEENRWINIASLVFDEEGELWYLSPVMDDFNPVYYENELGKTWELMQSTGLKDKNGVDIFEGDVVRFTWDMLSDVNATEKGKKVRISKVFWSDWRASWAVGKKSCNNDLFRYARNGNTVEVIGNIYENPELLEQANES